jgi:UDP-glucose 4-epimerase
MSKILLTGGAGLLGRELCRQLSNAGHEVWIIDNLSRSNTIPNCAKFIKADISNSQTFAFLPTDFDYIYHYGAINGTTNFYDKPNQVLASNFIGDIKTFEFAQTCSNLVRIVYASSSEIPAGELGAIPELLDIKINDIHNPRWSYRLAKITSENYLANSNLPYVMIRYYNVYGADDGPGHFLPDQIAKIKAGVFEIVGGNETRSFCHVEDACQATIYCAEHADRMLINIGNDVETKILDAAQIIAETLGHNTPNWNNLPGRPGSTATRRPDISRLKTIMPHFSPRTFEQGIRQILS